MGSVFLLGGALMGAPPHLHGPALNSLAYGALDALGPRGEVTNVLVAAKPL